MLKAQTVEREVIASGSRKKRSGERKFPGNLNKEFLCYASALEIKSFLSIIKKKPSVALARELVNSTSTEYSWKSTWSTWKKLVCFCKKFSHTFCLDFLKKE